MTRSDPPGGRPPGAGARTSALLLALTVALIVGPGGLLTARGERGAVLAPPPVASADWGLAPTGRSVEALEVREAALDRLRRLLLALGAAAAAVSLVSALALEASAGTAERFPVAVRAALGAPPGALVSRLLRRRIVPLLAAGLGAGALLGGALALALVLTWPGAVAGAPPPALTTILAGMVVLAALLVAAAPLRYARSPLARFLAPGGAGTDPREGGVRRVLSVLQMTLALGLVAGVAGTLRTTAASPPPDQDPASAGTVLVPVVLDASLGPDQRRARWEALLERARRTPTFTSESIATPGTWSGAGRVDIVVAECGACVRGGLPVPVLGEDATHHVVSPGFFEQTGLAILSGRGFTDRDRAGSAPVALVSRSFALANFEDGNPLGRRVRLGRGGAAWHTVVGVVEERPGVGLGRTSGREPAVYLAALQHPPDRADLALTLSGSAAGATRLRTDPGDLLAVAGVADVTLGHPVPVDDLRRRDAAPVGWIAFVGGLAGLAALLAALAGTWAVAGVEVRARRTELGVRAALGASPGILERWVLARSARASLLAVVFALPLVVGITGSVRATGGTTPLLDPALFAALATVLVMAAVAGARNPARVAASAEPARVLADE